MGESKLQARIINDLELHGWEVVKIIRCNKSGWPDVQAYKNNIAVFIECKDINKEAKPLQLFRHNKLRKQGFIVAVIDTWEGYLEFKGIYGKVA